MKFKVNKKISKIFEVMESSDFILIDNVNPVGTEIQMLRRIQRSIDNMLGENNFTVIYDKRSKKAGCVKSPKLKVKKVDYWKPKKWDWFDFDI